MPNNDVAIVTTLNSDSVGRLFGPVGAIDYRSHPGKNGEYDDPAAIFNKMKATSAKPLEDLFILKGTIYSFKNRRIITRWLRDVCGAFSLRSTTLCLAVQLTDIFLVGSLRSVDVKECQLAAVTALWISAKFEEMDADLPNLRKIVEVCDKTYSASSILAMEERILGFFKWRLPHTTVVNYVYLQINLLNSPLLITKNASCAKEKTVEVQVLLLDSNGRRTWRCLTLERSTTIQSSIHQLSAVSLLAYTASADVFQIFGTDVLIAERLPHDVQIKNLPLDVHGLRRLFVTTSRNQATSTFVERGSLVIMRSINTTFLDFCDFLTQEVVTHVEFLRLQSYVTAFGVIGLALSLLSTDREETKMLLQHIHQTLNISATQGLAVADLLCSKYADALPTIPDSDTLPTPSSDIKQTLAYCFDRTFQ